MSIIRFQLIAVLIVSAQVHLVSAQSKLEVSVTIGYSRPLLEAYGTDVTLSPAGDIVYIGGERWLVSDNLGTDMGYSVQSSLKYGFLQGYVKGLLNLGYTRLYSLHPGTETDYGAKLQSFSVGTGAEVNPLPGNRFYPSVFGLLRVNFIGGETFNYTGLDFFKVIPRYGYSAGINLNYVLNRKLGLLLGWSYSYDNLWGKDTDETVTNDVHTIVFRDKYSPTNGLSNDRRVAYASYFFGINFYLK